MKDSEVSSVQNLQSIWLTDLIIHRRICPIWGLSIEVTITKSDHPKSLVCIEDDCPRDVVTGQVIDFCSLHFLIKGATFASIYADGDILNTLVKISLVPLRYNLHHLPQNCHA